MAETAVHQAEDFSQERWLPVPGSPHYEVSDFGRVRSLDRVRPMRLKSGQMGSRRHKGVLLKPGTVKSGHQLVVLDGRSRLVHALVLTAFVGPRPPGHESLHNDGVASNNRLTNLRWGTRSENVLDAVRHGTYRNNPRFGEAHQNSKLTTDQVLEIRSLSGSASHAKIAQRFGVSAFVVGTIIRRKAWKHVP